MSEIQVKDMISALCREAERIEEDAMYSSKSHFNAEAAWEQRNNWLGIPATALAAIAGAASFNSYPEWAGILALLASLLAGLTVIARVDATPYDETFVSDSLISVRGTRGGAWPRQKFAGICSLRNASRHHCQRCFFASKSLIVSC